MAGALGTGYSLPKKMRVVRRLRLFVKAVWAPLWLFSYVFGFLFA